MVARTVLTKRQDAAIERIRAHARSVAGENPEIAEAAERVKNVPNRPDENHARVFRLEAIADLLERLDELTSAGEQPTEESSEPRAEAPKRQGKPQTARPRATRKAKK